MGIVLCECGFQHHGERPVAASTVYTIKKVLVFVLHTTDLFYFIHVLANCAYFNFDYAGFEMSV